MPPTRSRALAPRRRSSGHVRRAGEWRELEVLLLVADGLRNRDIAERLYLSTKTVAHHVASIMSKLGARSRGEAAAEAERLGLVER